MSKYLPLIKKVSRISIVISLFLPTLVSAAAKNLGQIFTEITVLLLKPFVYLLLTSAVVVFFWGMVKYIYSLGEKEKADGRWLMVWGVIALFVMVSVWGLVNILKNTLGLDNTPVNSIIILKSESGMTEPTPKDPSAGP